ncbi:DUF3576 domain-containing protein [Roseovarius rhodophyticola]|uniref:DUF3576 domain-containing protein n=1 Tax=Roseovarius rhodophyticola TaxID=3080827 RepID=A0ABZ2TFR2_9RHOB|nr:DUF3576 domain-containing protein [Roseovarius sp. W115]MDV2930670.1 DUF3576 domain-containing protein [Roseovarius sp. W115]
METVTDDPMYHALKLRNVGLLFAAFCVLASCSVFRGAKLDPDAFTVSTGRESSVGSQTGGSSLFDAFRGDGSAGIKVNRFLWTASLEVLDFLPVQNADPFTGVISTGFGTPPGGGRAYRATVLISDPALDARSLNVALQSRGGPVSAETQRAVEDAILTRARQLRQQAGRF